MFRRIFNYVGAAIGAIGVMVVMAGSVYALPNITLDVVGTPTVGKSFAIKVLVDGFTGDDITSFGFNTVFDPSWSLNGVLEIGPLFDDAVVPSPPQFAGNKKLIGDTTGNGILLATISYTPHTTGIFSYSITSDYLSNPNEGLLLSSFTNYDLIAGRLVTVNPMSVPEPATIILIGSGLIVLSGLALKNRDGKSKQI